MIITLQYLEDSPELLTLSPREVSDKLKFAFEAIPVTHLLIGWQLPGTLFDICQKESDHAGVKFIRWHPLLTGDGTFFPRSEWQVVGLDNHKVPGFQNMPEFTFVCPNHPDASGQILEHVQRIVDSGQYQGLFLDRIRFPSPAARPLQHLGCFCKHCFQAASDNGIDLEGLRKSIIKFTTTSSGKVELSQALLGIDNSDNFQKPMSEIIKWLHFRENSITKFCQKVTAVVRQYGYEIGLDCFSPGLTRMVGQNISALSDCADWIKIMCYAHTFGPAGLPFEILGFLDFLIGEAEQTEQDAISLLSAFLGIPLPSSCGELIGSGLTPQSLSLEIKKGIVSAKIPILAGLELVEIPGVAELNDEHILTDHQAAKSIGADGLSISWDLWNIPDNRLELISALWSE
jgi:hypothetical protein